MLLLTKLDKTQRESMVLTLASVLDGAASQANASHSLNTAKAQAFHELIVNSDIEQLFGISECIVTAAKVLQTETNRELLNSAQDLIGHLLIVLRSAPDKSLTLFARWNDIHDRLTGVKTLPLPSDLWSFGFQWVELYNLPALRYPSSSIHSSIQKLHHILLSLMRDGRSKEVLELAQFSFKKFTVQITQPSKNIWFLCESFFHLLGNGLLDIDFTSQRILSQISLWMNTKKLSMQMQLRLAKALLFYSLCAKNNPRTDFICKTWGVVQPPHHQEYLQRIDLSVPKKNVAISNLDDGLSKGQQGESEDIDVDNADFYEGNTIWRPDSDIFRSSDLDTEQDVTHQQHQKADASLLQAMAAVPPDWKVAQNVPPRFNQLHKEENNSNSGMNLGAEGNPSNHENVQINVSVNVRKEHQSSESKAMTGGLAVQDNAENSKKQPKKLEEMTAATVPKVTLISQVITTSFDSELAAFTKKNEAASPEKISEEQTKLDLKEFLREKIGKDEQALASRNLVDTVSLPKDLPDEGNSKVIFSETDELQSLKLEHSELGDKVFPNIEWSNSKSPALHMNLPQRMSTEASAEAVDAFEMITLIPDHETGDAAQTIDEATLQIDANDLPDINFSVNSEVSQGNIQEGATRNWQSLRVGLEDISIKQPPSEAPKYIRVGELLLEAHMYYTFIESIEKNYRNLRDQEHNPDAFMQVLTIISEKSKAIGLRKIVWIAEQLKQGRNITSNQNNLQVYSAASNEIGRLLHQFSGGFIAEINPNIESQLISFASGKIDPLVEIDVAASTNQHPTTLTIQEDNSTSTQSQVSMAFQNSQRSSPADMSNNVLGVIVKYHELSVVLVAPQLEALSSSDLPIDAATIELAELLSLPKDSSSKACVKASDSFGNQWLVMVEQVSTPHQYTINSIVGLSSDVVFGLLGIVHIDKDQSVLAYDLIKIIQAKTAQTNTNKA